MRHKLIIISFVAALLALSLGLFACAPQQNTSPDKKADSNAISFEWSKDSDCGMCHSAETASFDNSSCLANLHPSAKADCLSCHADVSGVQAAHVGVKPDAVAQVDKLKTTQVDAAACTSCHDRAKLPALTANCTILTDDKGTVVNPHSLTPSESHDAITCINCHKMHSDKPIADTATKTCADCHHDHVYECGTCHN